MAQVLLPTMDLPAPDPSMHRVRDWTAAMRLLRSSVPRRTLIADTLRLLASSVHDYLSERFESDIVKAALGWHAINDSLAGPSSAGTGYVLLHDHASGDPAGGIRQWGFVDGGMGRVTAAMADAATEAGATLRTNAERRRDQDPRRAGGGRDARHAARKSTPLPSYRTPTPGTRSCRSADDAALPEEFVRAIRAYRCEGTSMKINLALSSLPRVSGDRSREIQPYHQGILEVGPPLDILDAQQAQARQGHTGSGIAHRALLPDRARPIAGTGWTPHRYDRRELTALPRGVSRMGPDQRADRGPCDKRA